MALTRIFRSQNTTRVQDDAIVNDPARVDKERRASWLELFFDLAYVAVIAQLTYLVGTHHSPMELWVFLMLLIIIFFSWWTATVNRNLNEAEDTFTIFATQVQMFFALVMSFFLPFVFDGGMTGFVLGFVATRAIGLFLIERYYRINPERAPATRNVLHGLIISTIAWGLTIFLDPPLQYVMWTILIVFDTLLPFTKGRGNTVTLLNPKHYQERLGLFVLLVMGESVLVVAITGGISGTLQGLEAGVIAASGLVMLSALWWLYFPYIENMAFGKRPRNLMLYSYSHLLFFLAIILLAVGIKEFIGDAKGSSDLAVNIFILASLLISIISFNVIKFAMGHLYKDCLTIPIKACVLILALFALFTYFEMPGLLTLAALALGFCIYALFENKHEHTHDHSHG